MAMWGLSLMLPVALLVIIVIIVVIVKGTVTTNGDGEGSSQGGEEMIKTLYVYVVLFATLMMSIGGSVSAFMAVADIVAPSSYYQSYEDYRRWEYNGKDDYHEPDEDFVAPDESVIQANYDAMVLREGQRDITRAKNSLIKSFGWILIPLGIFIFYQRQLVKNKG